jgi:hypothetical protein
MRKVNPNIIRLIQKSDKRYLSSVAVKLRIDDLEKISTQCIRNENSKSQQPFIKNQHYYYYLFSQMKGFRPSPSLSLKLSAIQAHQRCVKAQESFTRERDFLMYVSP